MPPKFGTSGLRGLVTELTADCVTRYVQAFLSCCTVGTSVYVGHDLRNSSAGLAGIVAQGARDAGIAVTMCGPVSSPALALAATKAGESAIMVTGSHIPADRNGLKFYTLSGEITKADEAMIQGALSDPVTSSPPGAITRDATVLARYSTRYEVAFRDTLQGLHLGLYQHSAVGRDAMVALFEGLGAKVTVLGRSDVFIPVDTEAISDELKQQLRAWARAYGCDAVVSTDADGDRPLLTDEYGEVVAGDILGQITAAALGADAVVTPVSSNTGVELMGEFAQVIRTAIGSPFVIAAMGQTEGRIVGYEANGGFLLGFDAQGPSGPIESLMTRDAVLPILSVLAQSVQAGVTALVAAQPDRFTAAGRLQDIDLDAVGQLLQRLRQNVERRDAFLASLSSPCVAVDETDGLRMTLADKRIVHLRPSGNAPEMRLYVEAETPKIAAQTRASVMPILTASVVQGETTDTL